MNVGTRYVLGVVLATVLAIVAYNSVFAYDFDSYVQVKSVFPEPGYVNVTWTNDGLTPNNELTIFDSFDVLMPIASQAVQSGETIHVFGIRSDNGSYIACGATLRRGSMKISAKTARETCPFRLALFSY